MPGPQAGRTDSDDVPQGGPGAPTPLSAVLTASALAAGMAQRGGVRVWGVGGVWGPGAVSTNPRRAKPPACAGPHPPSPPRRPPPAPPPHAPTHRWACIVLYCVALHCVVLRCVALRCVVLRCSMSLRGSAGRTAKADDGHEPSIFGGAYIETAQPFDFSARAGLAFFV